MGMEISSSMLVGGSTSDLTNNLSEEELEAFEGCEWSYIEYLGLTVTSPYYDAHTSSCYIGFEVHEPSLDDFDKWQEEVKKLFVRYKELTGCDATLFSTPNVW